MSAKQSDRFALQTIRSKLRSYASARRECPALEEVRQGRVEGALSVAFITDLITTEEYEHFHRRVERIRAAAVTRGTTAAERIAA